jgi:hypothetical protein
MRRPAQGATARPGPPRPGSGYGRALGRPGPAAVVVGGTEPELAHPELAHLELAHPDQAVIAPSAAPSPGEPGPVPAI